MSGVDTVELEVRELVRRLVDDVVADYDDRALTSTLAPLGDTRPSLGLWIGDIDGACGSTRCMERAGTV